MSPGPEPNSAANPNCTTSSDSTSAVLEVGNLGHHLQL
jgi:hypothetical protein